VDKKYAIHYLFAYGSFVDKHSLQNIEWKNNDNKIRSQINTITKPVHPWILYIFTSVKYPAASLIIIFN